MEINLKQSVYDIIIAYYFNSEKPYLESIRTIFRGPNPEIAPVAKKFSKLYCYGSHKDISLKAIQLRIDSLIKQNIIQTVESNKRTYFIPTDTKKASTRYHQLINRKMLVFQNGTFKY